VASVFCNPTNIPALCLHRHSRINTRTNRNYFGRESCRTSIQCRSICIWCSGGRQSDLNRIANMVKTMENKNDCLSPRNGIMNSSNEKHWPRECELEKSFENNLSQPVYRTKMYDEVSTPPSSCSVFGCIVFQ
jgi:hypothetical protein